MISLEEMRKRIRDKIERTERCLAGRGGSPYSRAGWQEDIEMYRAILAALEDKEINHPSPGLQALITEREGMVAENIQRTCCGQSLAYSKEAFDKLAERMAVLDEPSMEERAEMSYLWENLGKLFVPEGSPGRIRGQLRDFPVFKQIRVLILGHPAPGKEE